MSCYQLLSFVIKSCYHLLSFIVFLCMWLNFPKSMIPNQHLLSFHPLLPYQMLIVFPKMPCWWLSFFVTFCQGLFIGIPSKQMDSFKVLSRIDVWWLSKLWKDAYFWKDGWYIFLVWWTNVRDFCQGSIIRTWFDESFKAVFQRVSERVCWKCEQCQSFQLLGQGWVGPGLNKKCAWENLPSIQGSFQEKK